MRGPKSLYAPPPVELLSRADAEEIAKRALKSSPADETSATTTQTIPHRFTRPLCAPVAALVPIACPSSRYQATEPKQIGTIVATGDRPSKSGRSLLPGIDQAIGTIAATKGPSQAVEGAWRRWDRGTFPYPLPVQ